MADRKEILKKAALAAGKAIKQAKPAGIVEKEGWGNFVTAADLESQKIITDLIKAHFPQDQILSEEMEPPKGALLKIPNLWVIDPLDGTHNFRYRRHLSVVSIGYAEKGETVLAGVYDPYNNELFYAEKGGGAYCNGSRIHVGTQNLFVNTSIATENYHNPQTIRDNLGLFLKISPSPKLRIIGCSVLAACFVAAGRFDLFFHSGQKPWDNAAAHLLVREAGGIVRGFRGEEIDFLSPEVVAGNRTLVSNFINAINNSESKPESK